MGCLFVLIRHFVIIESLFLASIIHNNKKRWFIISAHQVKARRVTPSYRRIRDVQYLFIVI